MDVFNLSPEQWEASALLDEVWDIMQGGGANALSGLKQRVPTFPHGVDPFYERQWLTNAIHAQAVDAVEWMVNEQVALSVRDDEGYTPLMSAIELESPDSKYRILESLLRAGAKPDQIGLHGAAAHLAALRGDITSLKILQEFGANLCLPHEDLGSWSTPLDHAIRHGRSEAALFLKSVCSNGNDRGQAPDRR